MLIVQSMPHEPNNMEWEKAMQMEDLYYIQSHEVGNILSYSSLADVENQLNCQKWLDDFVPSTAGANAITEWTISFEDVDVSDTLKSNKIGLEVSSSVSGWGVDLSVSGSYNREEITTHSSEFTEEVEIILQLGGLDVSIGEVEYQVMPFVYWARNGALVIDYAVDPYTTATPDCTWWENNYGFNSDPGFILPWRYHFEKTGSDLGDKRFLTRSIRMSPSVASEGDTVKIYTRVHNFSLLETPGSITVRFFVGDPDNGGVPIVGQGDVEELIITDVIPPQSFKEDSLTWTVPSGLDLYSRIYAVIDQDDSIDEVHENNNKGFIYFADISVDIDEDPTEIVPMNYALEQNYPNPFNPSTTISYQIPKPTQVEIKIYDILGRHIKTLVNEHQNAGQYQYQWTGESSTGSRVSNGIYLYRIKAGDYTMVKKMVLLK
jgi:hypothetical protein